jgi:hypothetical protein
MDTASRRLVAVIAICTLLVMAVMAGKYYSNSQDPASTAAVEPPAPLNDEAEAAMSADTGQQAASEFSTDMPTAEEIPAIDGKPSMTFDNAPNDNNAVAKESTKGIPNNSI